VIGKVLRGERPAGLIYYLYGPGKHEEHTDPHIVMPYNSNRRHMWLDVALCGVHLRHPWLHVAWRRLVSLHVGSPPGSQISLAPLMFEDLGGH
jgi:hypothetical protein